MFEDIYIKNLLDNKFLVKINSDRRIIVSLSGGVDSMVMLYILRVLTVKYNIYLEAFHINYGNRHESDIEEDVIKNYCEALRVKLHVFRFSFIKRKLHHQL